MEIKEIEQEIKNIKERNKRVELDKKILKNYWQIMEMIL